MSAASAANQPSPCRVCLGLGKVMCRFCDGRYVTNDTVCEVCHQGRLECPQCDGTGVDPWS